MDEVKANDVARLSMRDALAVRDALVLNTPPP
jgi:hypothetical protein